VTFQHTLGEVIVISPITYYLNSKKSKENMDVTLRLIYCILHDSSCIVLKLGSVIDSAGVLGHWVNCRTTESLVEPHD